jgi:hypothetical protein
MRTTIDLDDELLRTAKAISEANRQTLSRVISDLAWKGLKPKSPKYKYRNGFPVFAPSSPARTYSPKHVKEIAEEFEDGKMAAEMLS